NSIKIRPAFISVFVMLALIPFSYLEVIGFRIITFSFIAFAVLFLFAFKGKVFIDNNLLLFVLPFILVFMLSLMSGSKDYIAALFFTSYLLVFNFIDDDSIEKIFNKSLVVYVFGAVFVAVGTITQRVLF